MSSRSSNFIGVHNIAVHCECVNVFAVIQKKAFDVGKHVIYS